MSYVPHTAEEVEHMLDRIGAASLDQIFDSVPETLRTQDELKLSPALSEQAVLRYLRSRAEMNLSVTRGSSFLGAGAYHHFIPAAVDAVASRGEFSTAYTPYQAEISQGTLQAIFEFQTLMCQLTGLDVANASLYDGASAVAEAALMALRVTRHRRILASAGLHPHSLQVLRTYLSDVDAEIEILPLHEDGRTAPAAPPDDTAAVILQQPNFFGCVEDLEAFPEGTHGAGGLLVAATSEPLALALLRSPGDCGVDIACGEARSFGVPLSFGGPSVGYLAARQAQLRQLPGRLVGETTDSIGRRGFTLTLTTREQHIRREKATSNICTNQGLCALRVAVYLSLLGRGGLRDLARANLSLAHYARHRLEVAGLTLPYSSPFLNEFVVEVPDLERRHASLLERDIVAGLPLADLDPARRGQLLVCTTEMNGRAEIDAMVRGLT